jgi:hypothetical protein
MDDVLLSTRTLISTNPRISPYPGEPMWANSKPTQSTSFNIRGSVFSPISQAGCFCIPTRVHLKLIRIRGLLATSGYQIRLSFSKVRRLPFLRHLVDVILDICGKLEGESIVHASIPCTPNSWYLEELRLSQTSLPAIFPSPSAITTASLITSGLGGPFEDWREPIRKGLISLDSETCFRIRGSSHGNACPPTEEHTGTTLAHVQPRLSCFQPVSFEMYPKNKNSAYSNQSMALISIFQGFVRVREPTPSSEARLRL